MGWPVLRPIAHELSRAVDLAPTDTFMTSTPAGIDRLLQQVDCAPMQPIDSGARVQLVERADAVLAELVEITGSPLDRYMPQDAEFFMQFTKWTMGTGGAASVFSLQFSLWGELVCITKDEDAANENDLTALEQCPEILKRHGFVPVPHEQLQAPYTGNLSGGLATAPDADARTWHWRFFDWH